MSERTIEIRPLHELEQFDRCVELQLAIWNYSEGDLIPRRVFLVADRIGGQVLGAFDGDTIVGFTMGLPGYRNGHPYLHSHMMGVLDGYRNYGVGRSLKLAQREEALARGFDLIEWTYDPLEIKNSYLNITRLGAISRRYKRDFYGPSTSPLQGGLPTDRLYAEWWLNSKCVRAALAGNPIRQDAQGTVDVPAEIYAWKASEENRARAQETQLRNRDALEKAFAEGLSVVGYERDADGNGHFQLARWDEDYRY
ncbi:MAG: GNAT family N-acetyltransferase [Acidobacteria bacterium]|nr:GNAT family N-acetyltransferase [Acidobacteriota bacterium]